MKTIRDLEAGDIVEGIGQPDLALRRVVDIGIGDALLHVREMGEALSPNRKTWYRWAKIEGASSN